MVFTPTGQTSDAGRQDPLLERIERALYRVPHIPAPPGLRTRVFALLAPAFSGPRFPWKKLLFNLGPAPAFALVLWLVLIPDFVLAMWSQSLASLSWQTDFTTVLRMGQMLLDQTPKSTVVTGLGILALLVVYLRDALFSR